jgi:hypothetical protein
MLWWFKIELQALQVTLRGYTYISVSSLDSSSLSFGVLDFNVFKSRISTYFRSRDVYEVQEMPALGLIPKVD